MTSEILVPGLLLIAKFLTRLFVNQKPNLPLIILGILAFPVDLIFFSASLLAGGIISFPEDATWRLTFFILSIIAGIVVTVVWRCSDDLFFKKKFGVAIVVGLANYSLSLAILIQALSNLQPGAGQ
jgi:hypothetical protein